jgi:hypothetical protein
MPLCPAALGQMLERRVSSLETTAIQLEAARKEINQLRATLDDRHQRVLELEEVGAALVCILALGSIARRSRLVHCTAGLLRWVCGCARPVRTCRAISPAPSKQALDQVPVFCVRVAAATSFNSMLICRVMWCTARGGRCRRARRRRHCAATRRAGRAACCARS